MKSVHELRLRSGRPYLDDVPLQRFLDGLKRIVFVEDKQDLQHVNTGDLVVIFGGTAGRNPSMIRRLADKLERDGAAGLMIHSRSLKEQISHKDIAGELPVIIVPEEIEWAEVLQPLLRIDESLRSSKGNPERRRRDLLEKILANNGRVDIEAAAGREIGLDPTDAHLCYVVCTGVPVAEDALARLEEVVATELLDHDAFGTVVRRSTGVIAIDSTDGLGVPARLLARARTVPHLDTVAIGVGRAHVGARGIFRSYREARWASVVGNRLHGSNRVTHFDDLGPYAWLEPLDFDHDSDAVASIEALMSHDAANNTKLLETLQVFIESNRFKEAAQQLYVHRNTLRYRLESIKKLTGLDVLQGESRLVLELQLRLATVRGLVGPLRTDVCITPAATTRG